MKRGEGSPMAETAAPRSPLGGAVRRRGPAWGDGEFGGADSGARLADADVDHERRAAGLPTASGEIELFALGVGRADDKDALHRPPILSWSRVPCGTRVAKEAKRRTESLGLPVRRWKSQRWRAVFWDAGGRRFLLLFRK